MKALASVIITAILGVSACGPLPQKIHDKMPLKESALQKQNVLGVDLGFRYSKKLFKCLDEDGREGLNPGLLGACGEISAGYFPNGLANTDLQHIILDGSQISVSLDKALLTDTKMRGVQLLKGASLDEAVLAKTDLSHASLKSISLKSAKLDGAKFWHSELTGADFSQASLIGAVFVDAQLEGAKFDDADLTNVKFTQKQFDGASMTNAVTRNMQVCELKPGVDKITCKPAPKN